MLIEEEAGEGEEEEEEEEDEDEEEGIAIPMMPWLFNSATRSSIKIA